MSLLAVGLARMVVNAIDTKFSATIAPLSDREIAGFASSLSDPSSTAASLATLGDKGASAETLPNGAR